MCTAGVCEKFAENPEFRVGNFAVDLKREISHAKLKCHENFAPPVVCFDSLSEFFCLSKNLRSPVCGNTVVTAVHLGHRGNRVQNSLLFAAQAQRTVRPVKWHVLQV